MGFIIPAAILLGFFLGNRLPWLIHVIDRTGLVLLTVVAVGVLAAWWFHQHNATEHTVTQKPTN